MGKKTGSTVPSIKEWLGQELHFEDDQNQSDPDLAEVVKLEMVDFFIVEKKFSCKHQEQ